MGAAPSAPRSFLPAAHAQQAQRRQAASHCRWGRIDMQEGRPAGRQRLASAAATWRQGVSTFCTVRLLRGATPPQPQNEAAAAYRCSRLCHLMSSRRHSHTQWRPLQRGAGRAGRGGGWWWGGLAAPRHLGTAGLQGEMQTGPGLQKEVAAHAAAAYALHIRAP